MLNVVFTCTERKTRVVSARLQVRTFGRGTTPARCKRWIRRLNDQGPGAIRASDLYQGNHWHVVRSILGKYSSPPRRIQVWIASAGYGLIPPSACVNAYAATFSGGPDSVGSTQDARQWWAGLSKWAGPCPGQPRSLYDLAASAPRSRLLIVASASYARALRDDILTAAHALNDEQNLALISAGMDDGGALGRYWIEADGRFQRLVGGQMHSLNARLAQYALSQRGAWKDDFLQLRRLFAKKATQLPALTFSVGNSLTDTEVSAFIRRARARESMVGHSTLLRRLRHSGFACEQNRFRRIFRAATGATR